MFYRGMRAGIPSPADFASPGHEIAGTIRDGPPGLADVVYAVEPWVNCQDCPECLCGATNLCETGRLVGLMVGGGLADVVWGSCRYPHQAELAAERNVQRFPHLSVRPQGSDRTAETTLAPAERSSRRTRT